jgi:tetratricopeptide (TPR) repeat protein
MRTTLLIVALAVGFARTAVADDEALLGAVRAYDDGVAAYYDGQYEAALEAFLAAENTGYRSGALLYNIGNTYFRLNRLGMAVVYYERARMLIPSDDLLNHSARIAQRRTKNRFSTIPRPFWGKWWDAAVANIGPVWMYFVGLCFYLTAAVFLGARIWSGSRNDWLRRGVALCLVAGLPFLGAAFIASHSQATHRLAVVIELEADLRERPTEDADTATRVYEGLVVDLLERQEPWIRVGLPDGTTGWLIEDVIEEV